MSSSSSSVGKNNLPSLQPQINAIDTRVTALEAYEHLNNVFAPGATVAEIQAALDTDGYAYFLPGEYDIDETITMPRKYSCFMIGLGASVAYVKSAPISPGLILDGAVVFNWTGGSNEVMIQVLGAEFRLEGICLLGSDQTQTGVLIENGDSGTYAVRGGKGYIPYLMGADLDVLLQFGLPNNGDNGDVTSVGRLTAYDCNTIVRVAGGLGFELHFGYIRNARCDTVFDCRDGGGIYCNGVQILGDSGSDNTLFSMGVVSPNASTYHVKGLHVDSPASSNGFTLVNCTGRSWADITIEGHLPQGDYPVPIATLYGPVALKCHNLHNMRPTAITGISHAAGDPIVVVDSCRTRGSAGSLHFLTGAGSCRVTNCYNNNGAFITDRSEP